MTEKELFTALSELYTMQRSTADAVKQAKADAKASGISAEDIKAVDKAAKMWVDNNYDQHGADWRTASLKYETLSPDADKE